MPKAPARLISHWYTLIENFQTSTMSFYDSVEKTIYKREVPEIEISRVEWHEAGPFSATREYLRIARRDLTFDICGAPFGTGFFFSWWMGEMKKVGLLTAIIIVCLIFVVIVVGMGIAGFVFRTIFGDIAGTILSIFALPLIIWLVGALISHQGGMVEDAVMEIPLLGQLYVWIFHPATYYKIDTALMFQESVRRCVLEVIDELTSGKGIRALSEAERKPILSEFYQRRAS